MLPVEISSPKWAVLAVHVPSILEKYRPGKAGYACIKSFTVCAECVIRYIHKRQYIHGNW